jgi:hypothetical protein
MSFLRDFGLPELLIILATCCLPIVAVGGLVGLVLFLVKTSRNNNK